MAYDPENLERPNKSETKPKQSNPKTAKDLGRVAIGGSKKDGR
jgi:hypothetical protein